MIKSTITALALFLCLGRVAAQSADPAINIIMQPDTLATFTTGTLEVAAINIGNAGIASNSLEITVTASNNAQINGIAPGSDPRWTQHAISAGAGNTIVLRNTGGALAAVDNGVIYLSTQGLIASGRDTLIGFIAYIPGANSAIPGGAPSDIQGNGQTSNDMSMTSLVVTGSGPLSTRLISFAGQAKGCEAMLSWTTAADAGVERYEVEHSANGREYAYVGEALPRHAAGTSSYTLSLAQPEAVGYYRLKLIGQEGTTSFSNIVSIATACGETPFTVFPNPTRNVVTVSGLKPGTAATIYNSVGQAVKNVAADGANMQVDLSSMPSGVYRIKAVAVGGASVTATISKVD